MHLNARANIIRGLYYIRAMFVCVGECVCVCAIFLRVNGDGAAVFELQIECSRVRTGAHTRIRIDPAIGGTVRS